jgi:hypothetical protein
LREVESGVAFVGSLDALPLLFTFRFPLRREILPFATSVDATINQEHRLAVIDDLFHSWPCFSFLFRLHCPGIWQQFGSKVKVTL